MIKKRNSGKPLSRKEREYLLRKREILEAALRLFGKKGYHQTSMNEIAKEAEFSIGSLYVFFKNKEDLFYTLFTEEIAGIEKRVQSAVQNVRRAKEKLKVLVETLFSYFEERFEAFHIFALHEKEFDWALRAELVEMIRKRHIQFMEVLVQLIKQGIKEGDFRELRPEQVAMAFMGLINGSIFIWMESGRKYSLRERSSEVLDIFYKGVEKV